MKLWDRIKQAASNVGNAVTTGITRVAFGTGIVSEVGTPTPQDDKGEFNADKHETKH